MKSGTANMMPLKLSMARSTQVPRHAVDTSAMKPPQMTAMISAKIASSSVAGRRCAMMVITPCFIEIEVPRLPCRTCLNHTQNCCQMGRSRP